jgi:hypothetical protein
VFATLQAVPTGVVNEEVVYPVTVYWVSTPSAVKVTAIAA